MSVRLLPVSALEKTVPVLIRKAKECGRLAFAFFGDKDRGADETHMLLGASTRQEVVDFVRAAPGMLTDNLAGVVGAMVIAAHTVLLWRVLRPRTFFEDKRGALGPSWFG